MIFGFLGIGDIVIFSPCFRILRSGFPSAKITLVTVWKGVYDLFEGSEYIDNIEYFDFFKSSIFEKFRFINSLRKAHYDVSILPYPSYRREFNVFSRLVGASRRYAFDFGKGKIGEFAFLNNRLVKANSTIHNAQNNQNLLLELGLHADDMKYEIPVLLDQPLDLNDSNFLVGIHPGSDARGKDRRVDISKYAEISDLLVEKYSCGIIVFLGPHELDLRGEFLDSARHKHTIVTDKTLKEVAKLIANCSIFLSGDSGLMHIASAMGVPTVAIFGPTNPTFVRPWGVPFEIVRLGLKCSPCFLVTEKHKLNEPLIECKISDKFACVKGIEVKQIMEKIESLLASTKQDGLMTQPRMPQ